VDSQDKAAKSLIAKITVKQYCGIKIVKKYIAKTQFPLTLKKIVLFCYFS